MSHQIRDWMSSPAIFIDPDASVAHAMTLMRRRNIHSLLIDLASGNYGIITTTDIRDKIVAADRNPKATTVREIMSSPVITARADWTLKQCSLKMQSVNVHHLPVVDDAGTAIGMISAIDIFTAVEEIGWEGSG